MADNDELVSQWMAFTGSSDTARAASYLEMSGGDLETAVGLYMEHQGGGGGGSGGSGMGASSGAAGFGSGGPGGVDDVRAADETQNMRLIDDHGMGGMGGMRGMHPYMGMGMGVDPMLEEQLQQSAFASRPGGMFDARASVNSAVAEAAAAASDEEKNDNMDDESNGGDDDDDDGKKPDSNLARLADMFAPPEHIMCKEGGFEGARTMAKDNKRWLLVNIQRDSEFASHALNRDVWRNDLVENLVREGFVFWQAVSVVLLFLFHAEWAWDPTKQLNPTFYFFAFFRWIYLRKAKYIASDIM